MKIVISNRARHDLLRIHSFIAERNPDAAEAIIQDIDTKFEHISRFPFIGRERSSLAAGLRSVIVGKHIVFYVVQSDRIVVVRVIDGRMDIGEELKR